MRTSMAMALHQSLMTNHEVMKSSTFKKAERFENDGEFIQDDWEFELDIMHNPDHRMLAEHLKRAPAISNLSVEFLRGYIVDIRTTDIE